MRMFVLAAVLLAAAALVLGRASFGGLVHRTPNPEPSTDASGDNGASLGRAETRGRIASDRGSPHYDWLRGSLWTPHFQPYHVVSAVSGRSGRLDADELFIGVPSDPTRPPCVYSTGVEIPRAPGVKVTGRLVGPAGRPVAGARVLARPYEFDGVLDGRLLFTAVSDDTGSFTLTELVPVGTHELHLIGSDRGVVSLGMKQMHGPVSDLGDIVVPGNRHVFGQVLDAGSRPVSSGTVRLRLGDHTRVCPIGPEGRFGALNLEGPPTGVSIATRAGHRVFQSSWSDHADRNPVTLRLPLLQSRITVRDAGGRGIAAFALLGAKRTLTNDQLVRGSVLCSGVFPGGTMDLLLPPNTRWWLRAVPLQPDRVRSRDTAVTSGAPADIRLRAARRVNVSAVSLADSGVQPLDGAVIDLILGDGIRGVELPILPYTDLRHHLGHTWSGFGGAECLWSSWTTDELGMATVVLPAMMPDDFVGARARVSASGHIPQLIEVADWWRHEKVVLEMQRGYDVVFVSKDREMTGGLSLHSQDDDGIIYPNAWKYSEGVKPGEPIAGVPPGHYDIRHMRSRELVGTVTLPAGGSGRREIRVDIRNFRPLSLRADVSLPPDVGQWHWSLHRAGDGNPNSCRSGKSRGGFLEVEGLPAGEYHLTVTVPDADGEWTYLGAEQPLRPGAGVQSAILGDFRPWWRLLDAEGTPVRSQQVRIEGQVMWNRSGTTNTDGELSMDRPLLGSAKISCSAGQAIVDQRKRGATPQVIVVR